MDSLPWWKPLTNENRVMLFRNFPPLKKANYSTRVIFLISLSRTWNVDSSDRNWIVGLLRPTFSIFDFSYMIAQFIYIISRNSNKSVNLKALYRNYIRKNIVYNICDVIDVANNAYKLAFKVQ